MDRTAKSSGDIEGLGYVFGALAVGAGVGWIFGGAIVALLGGVASTTVATIVVGARRMRQLGRALDGDAPDLTRLPAKQALAALSGFTGGAEFNSPQLQAIDAIARTSETDPEAAVVEAERARDQFPRSPLLAAELARRCLALGREQAGRSAAAEAIVLALNGGMNPMAAKLLAEFADFRDAFVLDPAQWRRLAGAADAAGDGSAAAWCRDHVE